MTTVNSQAPIAPPTKPGEAATSNGTAPGSTASPATSSARASGIPSVNSRGGRAKGPGAKLFLVGACVLAIAVGSLVLYRNHQQAKAQQAAHEKQARRAENKPAAVNQRRRFDDVSIPAKPAPVAGIGPDCVDSESLLGNDGEPVLSVSGQPMRICKDGRIFVKDQPRRPVPPIAIAPRPPAKPPQARGPSRYGGATLLPALEEVTQAVERANQSGRQPTALAAARPQPTTAAWKGAAADGARMTPAAFNTGQTPVREHASEGSLQLAQSSSLPPALQAPLAPPAPMGTTPSLEGSGAPVQHEAIGRNLKPSETPRVEATMLGDRNVILPRGRSIDCALGVRVVTEVSGMAECIIASNVYSDNGKVLLVERGSQASGEYRANMALGQRRLFLLWNRIKTPSGVVIDLNSPASDALGASGLGGYVDNRWGDRVGAAVLISLVQDALAYGIERERSQGQGSAANYYNQPAWSYGNTERTGERIVEDVLAQTLQIRPTLYKNQGDRAAIYVARDLDFGSVYELQRR